MKPAVTLIPFLLLIFYISNYCSADDSLGHICNDVNTTQTSTNIDHLLTILNNHVNPNGFIATSYGSNDDKLYGLAQCRKDVSSHNCSTCIRDASNQIRKVCPTQIDARIWYDYCFLRYSKDDFAGKVDTSVGILYANVENVTDPTTFNDELGNLFDQIDRQATSGTGFGKRQMKISTQETLYGLSQCTGDLDKLECAQCLAIALQNFKGFCSEKKGCRVLYSSCYVRYEIYPFFFPMRREPWVAYHINETHMID